MHMTIDETRQNQTAINFDTLCLVASQGRRRSGFAHEHYSVTVNNDGVRPWVFSVRGEDAPALKNSSSSSHVLALL